MMIRLLGSLLIILGCGSWGFYIARNLKREIIALQNFVTAIEYMECELLFRMPALSDLCNSVGSITNGSISRLFHQLSMELESQISPDVYGCMKAAIHKTGDMPRKAVALCEKLGKQLGRFDLDGQVKVLSSLKEEGKVQMSASREGYAARARNYRTIAICAGAAVVILLI